MKTKTFGSIFILAGTTIGAGLLALPLSSAGIGFLPTVVLIIISYFINILASLILLETLSAVPGDEHLHFASIYAKTLGKWGEFAFMIAFVSLMYAIVSAYLAGGSDIILVLTQKVGLPITHTTATILFISVLGVIVCAGTQVVDYANRYIMMLKGVIFAILLVYFIPSITLINILDFKDNLRYFPIAIPIIFLIFGYQLVLPTLYLYLERDNDAMKKTIYLGSFISVVVFILWLLVSMGGIPRFGQLSFKSFLSQYSTSDIGDFFDMVGSLQSSKLARDAMNLFSNLALVTSFLGIALALKEYMADTKLVRHTKNTQLWAICFTFIPPFCVVALKLSLFQTALNYAAAMLVVVLIFLPILMVIATRRKVAEGIWQAGYKTPGGNFSLLFLSCTGLAIFVLSLLATINYLPSFPF